jgi:hypothetical protein
LDFLVDGTSETRIDSAGGPDDVAVVFDLDRMVNRETIRSRGVVDVKVLTVGDRDRALFGVFGDEELLEKVLRLDAGDDKDCVLATPNIEVRNAGRLTTDPDPNDSDQDGRERKFLDYVRRLFRRLDRPSYDDLERVALESGLFAVYDERDSTTR